MRFVLLALLLSGCVHYERAQVNIDGKQCVEPVPPIVVGQEISITAGGQLVLPQIPADAEATLKSTPQIVRLYSLGQSLLFLQSALFQLCVGAANGTISPEDHAKLVARVIKEAGTLLWLESGGPFEGDEVDDAETLPPQ